MDLISTVFCIVKNSSGEATVSHDAPYSFVSHREDEWLFLCRLMKKPVAITMVLMDRLQLYP